jgi:hypothetical protein
MSCKLKKIAEACESTLLNRPYLDPNLTNGYKKKKKSELKIFEHRLAI